MSKIAIWSDMHLKNCQILFLAGLLFTGCQHEVVSQPQNNTEPQSLALESRPQTWPWVFNANDCVAFEEKRGQIYCAQLYAPACCFLKLEESSAIAPIKVEGSNTCEATRQLNMAFCSQVKEKNLTSITVRYSCIPGDCQN